MHEATIEETETGRQPANDGWFILNLAEMGWETLPGGHVVQLRVTRRAVAATGHW